MSCLYIPLLLIFNDYCIQKCSKDREITFFEATQISMLPGSTWQQGWGRYQIVLPTI